MKFIPIRSLIFLCFSLLFVSFGSAQTYKITGKILEKENLQVVIGASISLKSGQKIVGGTASNEKGLFQINNVLPDTYSLTISYIGLKTKVVKLIVSEDKTMGAIFLEKSDQALKEIKIEAKEIRVEQIGDTTSINASAFKVNPDATAEDLLKKMPGITIENGTIKAQGEDVKKVLLDGKEFFGDDAQMALKNLPAEIIDKVQVFNRLGDQAQFTGFNDGNTDKTVNITTKTGKSNGKFGKIFAGYGTNDRYQAGVNYNLFNGDRRLTVLGMSNNINQQNFSMQDLFGGGSSRMPSGGGGGRSRSYGMSSSMADFFVGQQTGISRTNSIGLNYSDVWKTKTKVSASYFFNNSNTKTQSTTNRTYLINNETAQLYKDSTTSETTNFNNRFNMRLEHMFDSSNALIYSPRLSFQTNNNTSDQLTGNYMNDTLLNATLTNKKPINTGYTITNNILFRHKFSKVGRTISLNLVNDYSKKNSETDQYSDIYTRDTSSVLNLRSIQQLSTTLTTSNNNSANLTYTERLTDSSMLQFSYNPGLNLNFSDKQTNGFDTISQEYSTLNTLLSNTFDNKVTTHKFNVGVNINKAKYSLTAGVTQQFLTLSSLQTYPINNQFDKSFSNLLPNVVYKYNLNATKSIRMVYRTNTNTPSVTQLQNVIDNTNPLMLSAGNPNLGQEYSHTFLTRYGSNNRHSSQSFFIFAMATLTNNYIANGTFTATKDSILPNGMIITRGAQINQPINLDGNVSARSFATYGLPLSKLKSNLNVNLGVNYSKVPGMVNYQVNYANTFNITGGMVLGSNISDRVDFTVSHNANINLVTNTLLANQNSNYFINSSDLKINVMPTVAWVINTQLNYTNYQGLGSSFNQDFLLWNAGIAYKFLKRMAEVKLSVFDLLNQNNSISRTVTETYIEDTKSNVLNRYFMITFTYNLRKFTALPPPPTFPGGMH
ncbi:MAG: outer membrane beta-barrel protein [Bacteroidia bacterium]|nr:outer membrane beta-barrel protein [Bacteroidia bacterium]MCF8426541.1 outer membrane beta-barrel protein [Bacteroidia bacterium]